MSKKLNKIFAVILALVMVVGCMQLTAFADQIAVTAGSITVHDLYAGDTVKSLQIIMPSDAATTGWVFASDAIAAKFATAYGITSTDALKQDVMAAVIADYEGTVNGAATSGANNGSEKFRAALQAIADDTSITGYTTITDGSAGDTNATDGAVTFTTAANTSGAGVYLLKANTEQSSGNNQWIYNNMAAYVNFGTYDSTSGLPTALATVSVNAKHMTNTVDKEIDTPDESIAIGDTADYTITSYYPFFAAQYQATASYKISDSSAQLNNYTNIVVTVEGETNPLVAGTDYILKGADGTSALTAADQGFTIIMIDNGTPAYNASRAGKVVTVTYDATVIALTASGTVENTGVVETKPNDSSSAWRTESKVITDTYECEIDKVNDEATPDFLTGAHFVCKNESGTAYSFISGGNGVYTLVNGTTPTGQTVTSDLVVGDTAPNKGKLIIKGLDSDLTYVFTETQAPAGYTLNDTFRYTIYPSTDTNAAHTEKPVKTTTVTEALVGDVKTKTTTESVTFAGTAESYTCVDTPISALPSTGGIGTYIFTFVGVAVMAAAVVFFLGHKKAEV